MPKGKERQLLFKMAEAYWRGGGMTTEELCRLTPAYSQRFGDWRKNGIMITKEKNDAGGYTYFLRTDPEMIDWDNYTLIMRPDIPIKAAGMKVKKDDNQLTIKI